MHLAHDGALHEEDGKDEHDSGAERREHGGGLVAGAVEIGESVAQRGRQMQTRLVEERSQRAQGERRQAEDNEQRGAKHGGEPLPDQPRVGERGGDAGESRDDDDHREPLEFALAEFRPPPSVEDRRKYGEDIDRERLDRPRKSVMAQSDNPQSKQPQADKQLRAQQNSLELAGA